MKNDISSGPAIRKGNGLLPIEQFPDVPYLGSVFTKEEVQEMREHAGEPGRSGGPMAATVDKVTATNFHRRSCRIASMRQFTIQCSDCLDAAIRRAGENASCRRTTLVAIESA